MCCSYLLIMPTLLQIYSNFQNNKLVRTTIEYAVKQFYLLNRKPFILQMFGSVSAILDTDEDAQYGDASKVSFSISILLIYCTQYGINILIHSKNLYSIYTYFWCKR